GRTHHAHRLVLDCSEGLPALRAALADHLAGRHRAAPVAGPGAAWLAGEDVDWRTYWTVPARRVPLPTGTFPAGRPRPEPTPAPSGADVARIERRLVQLYARASGLPEDGIDPHTPLEQYGLTSFLVARLNADLREEFGVTSATVFFEQRDLAGVARGVCAHATTGTGERSADGPTVAERAAERPDDRASERASGRLVERAGERAGERVGDDIAVIGLAGRYPGSPTPQALWEHLLGGTDLVTELPADRRTGRPGEELMHGGFLDAVADFDPLLFGITPHDADLMDPQERLLLEVVWETLEDAGHPRDRLRTAHGSRVGVFVGSMHNEYPYFGVERTITGTPVAGGSTPAGIANRVSYFLDAHGPSLTVDTMCSSSLTAIHLAARSLRDGECAVALAAGVNLSLHPNKYVQQRAMHMTSSDHRCRGFGAGGDGFVPAEAVGAVLLKPLARAVADGDRIHGVIKGTAVSHGGRTNGYTVPDPAAQGRVVTDALVRSGVPAGTVGYVEAHGTGTALGDPVEIAGLQQAFGALAPGSVAIGTVKSNIGHTEAAAGIAGLTKVLLQMRYGLLVPSLHTEELNLAIDWATSPFRVQRAIAEWPRPTGGPRRAGVSSFGAGGSNAHLVVEEYPQPAYGLDRAAAGPQLVVLSGRTEEALTTLAGRLAAHLRQAGPGGVPDETALADLAHTSRIGREELRERLALVVSSVPELADRLTAFAAGRGTAELRGRVTGPSGPGLPVERIDPSGLELEEVARRWVTGTHWDWQALPGAVGSRIVPMPTYPFARRHCWLPEPPQENAMRDAPQDVRQADRLAARGGTEAVTATGSVPAGASGTAPVVAADPVGAGVTGPEAVAATGSVRAEAAGPAPVAFSGSVPAGTSGTAGLVAADSVGAGVTGPEAVAATGSVRAAVTRPAPVAVTRSVPAGASGTVPVVAADSVGAGVTGPEAVAATGSVRVEAAEPLSVAATEPVGAAAAWSVPAEVAESVRAAFTGQASVAAAGTVRAETAGHVGAAVTGAVPAAVAEPVRASVTGPVPTAVTAPAPVTAPA
ncbi:beta-ketoacyl synthase N-terminal-like domain-containing protein, partial [Streptomyces sp. SID3212]|uniref:beta-ketoacyl synthase N-terminal-like domain-containing protein n=1 Tax=Streptomyces sp. SID3212 TaxID=2690259 RepID=UPI0013CCCE25